MGNSKEHPLSQSGFTLLEMLIGLGMIAGVALLASTTSVSMMKGFHDTESRASLDEEAKILTGFIVSKMQGIGGGSARPWASIWVEDNCAARAGMPDCGGSDRVSMVESDPALAECQIVSLDATGHLQVAAPAGVCCLSASYGQRQAVISSGMSTYAQYFISSVDTAACVATLTPGQAYGGINSPPATLPGWANGILTVAKVSTLYLDSSTQILNQFVDANNDNIIDAGESTPISDRIVDLQVALGYDCNPSDGKLPIAYNDQDEWLYDAIGPLEALGSGGLALATPSLLRMAAIGVIMGQRSASTIQESVSLLNGPARQAAGWQYRKALSFLRFRSLDLFLVSKNQQRGRKCET